MLNKILMMLRSLTAFTFPYSRWVFDEARMISKAVLCTYEERLMRPQTKLAAITPAVKKHAHRQPTISKPTFRFDYHQSRYETNEGRMVCFTGQQSESVNPTTWSNAGTYHVNQIDAWNINKQDTIEANHGADRIQLCATMLRLHQSAGAKILSI